MTRAKNIATIFRTTLFCWTALLYILYSSSISTWIPTISLTYWFFRGSMGRPKVGKSFVTTTLYQFANASVACVNAIVFAIAFHSISEGKIYQRMIADSTAYWGTSQHIIGHGPMLIVLVSVFLTPISAIIFSGSFVTYIIKHEWYASWRFARAKSRFFKDIK